MGVCVHKRPTRNTEQLTVSTTGEPSHLPLPGHVLRIRAHRKVDLVLEDPRAMSANRTDQKRPTGEVRPFAIHRAREQVGTRGIGAGARMVEEGIFEIGAVEDEAALGRGTDRFDETH